MAITDELRDFMDGADGYELWCPRHKVELADIADRIDAAHRSALEKLAAQLDESEDGWVRLPVDADGEVVRVGDVMEWPTTGETFEVVGIGDGTLFYVGGGCDVCADWTGASTKRHHHKSTVEDVLREFADRVCDSGHQWGLDAADTIAEFASKLRMAGDE